MTTFSAVAFIQEALFSDLFKDTHGFRPRGAIVERWLAMSEVELTAEYDRMCADHADAVDAERREQAAAVERFEREIADLIVLGAGDRATALRWFEQAEGLSEDDQFYGDTGYLEYSHGLPYGYLGEAHA